MKNILLLLSLLASSLPAQSWHRTDLSAHRQPNSLLSNTTYTGNSTTRCALGEVSMVAGSGWYSSSIGALQCWAARPTPVSVGGGFYDDFYDENDFVPLLMLDTYSTYSAQVSGVDAGWDYLFCDPSTMTTQFVYTEPNFYATFVTWDPRHPSGYQNHYELADYFLYVLPDLQSDQYSWMIGMSFTAQWAVVDPNSQTRFSNAIKLTAQ